LVIRVMSASVAERIICMLSGEGIREAARPCTPLERPLATGPAWPSWPPIFAPVSCTASARRARPGADDWSTTITSLWVRPSGATER
jgi:hypothetical protein